MIKLFIIALVFAVSEMSIDHAASNFAMSSSSCHQQQMLSRGTPTSIVTVVIDEGIVRVSAPEPPSPPDDVNRRPSFEMEPSADVKRGSTFEMATSFSVADEESDDGLQVRLHGPLVT